MEQLAVQRVRAAVVAQVEPQHRVAALRRGVARARGGRAIPSCPPSRAAARRAGAPRRRCRGRFREAAHEAHALAAIEHELAARRNDGRPRAARSRRGGTEGSAGRIAGAGWQARPAAGTTSSLDDADLDAVVGLGRRIPLARSRLLDRRVGDGKPVARAGHERELDRPAGALAQRSRRGSRTRPAGASCPPASRRRDCRPGRTARLAMPARPAYSRPCPHSRGRNYRRSSRSARRR